MSKGAYKAIRKRAVVRTEPEKVVDERFIADMYGRGHTVPEVTKMLNENRKERGLEPVSESVVSVNLTELKRVWRSENIENINNFVTREDMRLEKLRDKAQHEYEASKNLKPKDYAPLIKTGMTIDEIRRAFKDTEFAGDSSFMNVELSISEQQMKLRGVDKGDVSQTNVVNYNFKDVGIDELARMADGLQDRKAKEIYIDKQS